MTTPSDPTATAACPTCGDMWTASPANVGPPMPGLECPDRWHIDNYPEDDNDE